MTRRRRIAWIALGGLVLLATAAGIFFATQVRPMLTPELRRAQALRTLASRGVDDVRSVDVPFGDVTVRAYSTARGDVTEPVVVFVHGSPGDWTDFVDQLSDPGLRDHVHMISIDRLGYGGSDFGHPEGSLRRQARALIAVLDHFGTERAVLVGHSLGGPVVARAAMDFPDRVAGIVPVGSSADPSLEETTWYQMAASWSIVRPLLPAMLDVCNQEILPHRTELEAMADDWASIECPVVIVHGEEDVLVPVANVDFMAARIRPDLVTIRRYPDMNHFVPWSHPERMREAILETVTASTGLRATD